MGGNPTLTRMVTLPQATGPTLASVSGEEESRQYPACGVPLPEFLLAGKQWAQQQQDREDDKNHRRAYGKEIGDSPIHAIAKQSPIIGKPYHQDE